MSDPQLQMARRSVRPVVKGRYEPRPTAIWRFGSPLPTVSRRFGGKVLGALVVLALWIGANWASAGEVRMRNGTVIQGKPVPIQGLTNAVVQQTQGPINVYPILLVDTGMQRYFVPARQVAEINNDADLSRYETFKLPQRTAGRKLMVQSLGSYTDVTDFDEFGRRRVTLATSNGPLHIVQGVTDIRPQYLTVTGITHLWEHGIATTSVPPPVLDAMIRKATNPMNPDDRMAIARFYLQAELYRQADVELESIVKDFPELKDRVNEISLELRQLQAKQVLSELRRRRAAGQHQLALTAAQRFPVEKMSESVLREIRELTADYAQARERGEKALALLGEFQAELKDPNQISGVIPLRSELNAQLDYESLGRLEAFLRLAEDDTLSPSEKLALAYSGWVLGSANAITDLNATLRLWEARFHVLEYLRTDSPLRRNELLAALQTLEGAGFQKLVQMVPHLPATVETPQVRPGQALKIDVNDDEAKAAGLPVAYWVLLPPEYSPHHRYPLVVALRPGERTAEKQLVWWGGTAAQPGQSQRHGYIVIAPEYADEKTRAYDFQPTAHYVVLQSIRDACKRFNIDSDRIFLGGHGMGGDAAFDIGMSHPDVFAGVVPIAGFSDKYCKWYWPNAKHTAWYVVAGELDRDSLSRNSREINRMMQRGFEYDVIYTEYIGRGYEDYYSEIHKLFDWMDARRRVKPVKDVEARVLRQSDNRSFWIRADGLPANVLQANVLTEVGGQRVLPMTLTAEIKDGSDGRTTIYVKSGAATHTLWLSPEIVDFDKRLAVRIAGRQKFNDFLRPDIEALLEDLRLRGDRQRLAWVRLEVN